MKRREFLGDTLWAATVAALGASRHAWAQPVPPKPAAPSERVRVAVLGVRGRGQDHVRAYVRMADATVAAICDPDLNVIGPALKIVTGAGRPEPKVAQDLRRILDDPDIDAVSIATPNHWHALAAIWAMQAGKDAYVEKPVSHNVREGRIMADAARRYRRICQAGTQIRSMEGSKAAIGYLHEGKIGRILVARGLCYKPRGSIGKGSPGAVPFGVNYNLWLGPAPHVPYQENQFHYNWHWLWATGNGDLGNQGIHQMDVARWGLNKTTLPKSVVGLGGRFGYEDDGETPNTHVAVLDYGDSQILFETRGLKTDALQGARIGNIFHGTEGTVVLTSYAGGAAFDTAGNRVATFEGGGDHFRNFIDCVKSRKAEDLAGEITEGHLSSALCHLGNISYLLGETASFGTPPTVLEGNEAALETFARMEQHLAENGVDTRTGRYRLGRKLALDVKAEDFGRDDEANVRLFREYRRPFVVPDRI